MCLKESEQELINDKKTAALVLSVIMTALMLTACSKEEQVDYTEAENALQASLVGYWTDDMALFEKTVAEENAAVSVLEFTEDYKYLWHECDFEGWQIKTYEPTKYSFEELMIKIDNNGEEAFAKLELSSDGETLYWITDEHTYDYTRVPSEAVEKIGVPKQKVEKPVQNADSETQTEIQLNGNTSTSGYVLDPTYKFDVSGTDMDFTNYASLIAEAGDTKIYGVYPDGKEPLVFIEQGSVIDEFEQNWLTPRRILPKCEWLDADGDGEDELAVSYYVGSGSGISIEELVIYKKGIDGHFTAHRLDAAELIDEHVNYYIDNDYSWLDFAAYDTDEIYSTSIAIDYPDGIEEIFFGNVVSFELDSGKIEMHTTPGTSRGRYDCMPEIIADVIFDGEEFDLENIDFEENE